MVGHVVACSAFLKERKQYACALSFSTCMLTYATYPPIMKLVGKMRTPVKFVQTLVLCMASLLVQPKTFAQSGDLAAKSQRAKTFMAEGKFARAIPLYRELNQSVPNNPGLMLNLGMALHLAGEERKAIPALESATKL